MDREETQQPSSLTALMRAARQTYALAVRGPLSDGGFEDIPRDGVFAITAICYSGATPGDLAKWLGTSKQAVSQLIDALVLRGYVVRVTDSLDRRRMKLTLTERGQAAVAVSREAVGRVEQRIREVVGPVYIEHTRATLKALIELASEWRPSAQPLGA